MPTRSHDNVVICCRAPRLLNDGARQRNSCHVDSPVEQKVVAAKLGKRHTAGNDQIGQKREPVVGPEGGMPLRPCLCVTILHRRAQDFPLRVEYF